VRGTRRTIDLYSILWTIVALAVTSALILFAIFRKVNVDEADITAQAQLKSSVNETEFDPDNPPDFTVKHAEIVLSEKDGSLKLRLITDAIIGENKLVGVKEVVAEFRLASGEGVSIEAHDCKYRIEGKEAVIDGEVHGELPSKGQSFTANKLSWSEDSAIITAHNVNLEDPQMTARGAEMKIDLSTGKVTMSNGVVVDM
jgi:LPS export ABC transporter protein LptC